MSKVTPFLWFDAQAEEAAEFYTSIFQRSRILEVTRHGEAGPGPAGSVMVVRFELDGQQYLALNGGDQGFHFNESVSFVVNCTSQDEVDYFWGRLTEGGEEGQCGWLKDKYGLSWQVVPDRVLELLKDPDPERSQRAMQAMLKMKKLDIGVMERAAAASPTSAAS
ncbi:MAG TPA: VOC family protein [Acidimicrobiales bacterium]|nr:VOC family protein [Acidimicrobiales bacterium]